MSEDNYDFFHGYVKSSLENIEKNQTNTNTKLDEMNKEIIKNGKSITALKVKASLWGALGGLLPVCIVVGYFLIRELIK